ncbi:V-type ATP synthase subunit E family protein [Thermoanaerobacterium sp. RBIITD]|uniref:V-type ATP synthase subunit E n=1 Tax=Thermoanaerobacterium sp. RBIITD TaxID=1550240 RepID=UPI000BB8020F|nr:V-type ATP synthase subunit E family protein [Thermoanaerobacterium sp. RBIITD]SNX53438.1 V/A-type H+-transporting ATPase subunit E [Thermoanaerobacterium sp. RBIITD]
MPSIQDKVALFNRVLYENINKEYEEKKNAILKNYENQKAALLAEKEKIEKPLRNTSKQKAETKKQQMISKAQYERHYKLLKKKKELEERFFAYIVDSAREFVKTEEYTKFLFNLISDAIKTLNINNEAHFYFTKDDIEKHGIQIGTILNSNYGGNYYIEEAKIDIIGGFYIETTDMAKRFDATIMSMIEEKRSFIGQKLSEKLDSVQL